MDTNLNNNQTLENNLSGQNEGNQGKPEIPPGFVSKELFDRKVSELNKKRKSAEEALQARLTEEEKAESARKEQEEAFSNMQKELEKLKNEKVFLSNGFDAETASMLAEQFASRDIEAFIATCKEKYESKISDLEKEIERLNSGRVPPVHSGDQSVDTAVAFAAEIASSRNKNSANREELLKKLIQK